MDTVSMHTFVTHQSGPTPAGRTEAGLEQKEGRRVKLQYIPQVFIPHQPCTGMVQGPGVGRTTSAFCCSRLKTRSCSHLLLRPSNPSASLLGSVSRTSRIPLLLPTLTATTFQATAICLLIPGLLTGLFASIPAPFQGVQGTPARGLLLTWKAYPVTPLTRMLQMLPVSFGIKAKLLTITYKAQYYWPL